MRDNAALGLRIADGALVVADELAENFLQFVSQALVHRADLRTQRMDWAAQHAAVLFKEFLLLLAEIAKAVHDTLHWRHHGGKDLVQVLAVLGPAVVNRGQGQFSFGLKEVVKAALLHPCPVADMIY